MNDKRTIDELLQSLKIENYAKKVFNIIDHSYFSHSKLGTFNKCKRSYKYKYIDKVKVDSKDDAIHFIKGRTIHNLLENHYGNSEGIDKNVSYQLSAISTNDILKWNDIHKSFINSELGIAIKDSCSNSKVVATEERLEFNDKVFTGSVDFLYITDNVLNIIDWKTGKYKELPFTQLATYAYYMINKYYSTHKFDKVVLRYVFVEHGKTHDLEMDLREFLLTFENVLDGIRNTINLIEIEKEWKITSNSNCRFCSYKEHCDNDESSSFDDWLNNL